MVYREELTEIVVDWRKSLCVDSSKPRCKILSSMVRRSSDLNAIFNLFVDDPLEFGTEFEPDKLRLFNEHKSNCPTHSNGSQWKALIVDAHEAIKHFPCASNSTFFTIDSKGRLCDTHSSVSMSQNRTTLSSLAVANRYSTGLKRTDKT